MATVAGAPTAAPLAAPPKSHGLTGRARAERKLGLMLALPAVIVMALVAGFPILYAFWLSLHRADLRFPYLTKWIGLDNYWYVLRSHTWWTDVLNTVIITGFSVVLELALGLIIAEAMYRDSSGSSARAPSGGKMVASEELQELRDDAGGVTELTDAGDTVLVARLSPESRARSGEQAELWLDATKMHFFDEQSGEALTFAH